MAPSAGRRPGLGAWIFIAVLAAAGIGVAGTGIYSFGRWTGFVLRAETVPGVVDRIVPIRRSGVAPVFRYETPAGTVTESRSRNPNGWARFAPGDAVTLRVDPDRRDWAEADSLAFLLFGSALTLPFGGILLGMAWLAFLASTRPRDTSRLRVRRNKMRWARNPTVRDGGAVSNRELALGLGLPATTLLAMLAIFVGLNEILAALAERRGTEWVQARVAEVATSARAGEAPHAYQSRFVFTAADGRWIRVGGAIGRSPRHAVGEAVTLRHRRGAPETAVEAGIWDFRLRPAAFAIGAMLACLPLLLLLRWLVRTRQRATPPGGPITRA